MIVKPVHDLYYETDKTGTGTNDKLNACWIVDSVVAHEHYTTPYYDILLYNII